MIRHSDLLAETMKTQDSGIRDIMWGYLSGVDREGSNFKGKSEITKIEEKLKEQHPNQDVCLLRLQAKYARGYD